MPTCSRPTTPSTACRGPFSNKSYLKLNFIATYVTCKPPSTTRISTLIWNWTQFRKSTSPRSNRFKHNKLTRRESNNENKWREKVHAPGRSLSLRRTLNDPKLKDIFMSKGRIDFNINT